MDSKGVMAGITVALIGAIVFAFGAANMSVIGIRILGGFGLMGLIIGVAVIFDRI